MSTDEILFFKSVQGVLKLLLLIILLLNISLHYIYIRIFTNNIWNLLS